MGHWPLRKPFPTLLGRGGKAEGIVEEEIRRLIHDDQEFGPMAAERSL